MLWEAFLETATLQPRSDIQGGRTTEGLPASSPPPPLEGKNAGDVERGVVGGVLGVLAGSGGAPCRPGLLLTLLALLLPLLMLPRLWTRGLAG